MTVEQSKTLWLSIEHWLEVWDNPEDNSVGRRDCACCLEWINDECIGCPIYEHTGQTYCQGTPYVDAADTLAKWGLFPSWHTARISDQPDPKLPIEKEYTFLVNLALEIDDER